MTPTEALAKALHDREANEEPSDDCPGWPCPLTGVFVRESDSLLSALRDLGYVLVDMAALDALPTHSIGGWEWECSGCQYDTDSGDYKDSLGNVCDHFELLDKSLVLRTLSEPKP